MPTSHYSNWPPLRKLLKRLNEVGALPERILDLGCGKGNIGTSIRNEFPSIIVDGIDIFEKNVIKARGRTTVDGEFVYRQVHLADIREYNLNKEVYDLFITYDVLEHMSREESMKIIDFLKGKLIMSVPLGVYEQGPVGGNVHEEHVDTWEHEDVMAIHGAECLYKGKVLGVYYIG